MDTLKKQIIDAEKAREIFSNTHARLDRSRKKTDEEYLSILIDEVNIYFSSLSTSTINSNDLPSVDSGPNSNKHNKLVLDIVRDIDLLHGKQRLSEQLLTRAVNFMSSERISITNTASKLQSRMVNNKLKSMSNDRNITVFSEYFNDIGLTDIEASVNFDIDPSLSALTLAPIVNEKDNSSIIDPKSIKIYPIFNDTQDSYVVNSIYPLCNQTDNETLFNDTVFSMGYGDTLSNDDQFSVNMNAINASDYDESKIKVIQKACLKYGDIVSNNDNVVDGLGDDTHCEFEMIWNDFRTDNDTDIPRIKNDIIASISDGGIIGDKVKFSEQAVIVDDVNGKSFSGSKNNNDEYIDEEIPYKKISEFVLEFKIREGIKLIGNLTNINILFSKPTKGGFIPEINYAKSLIFNTDGFPYKPFVNPPNTISNNIVDAKSMMLSTNVDKPSRFKIFFKVGGDGSAYWKDIEEYIGMYWEVPSIGSTIQGTTTAIVEIDGVTTGYTSGASVQSSKTTYIYHDMLRYELPDEQTIENKKIAKLVIGSINSEVLDEDTA